MGKLNSYFVGRDDFELRFKLFMKELNYLEHKDFEMVSHMFLLTDLNNLLLISYIKDEKYGNDLYIVEDDMLVMIETFKTYNELENYLYSLKKIQKHLREKKLKRILNNE